MLDARRWPVAEHAYNGLMWSVRPLSGPLEVLLHRDVGERFPGFACLLGLGQMELCSLFADQSAPLHLLMAGTAAAAVVARVRAVRARRRGEPWSSRSSGTPWLSVAFPGLPAVAARWAEPFAAFAVGMLVKSVNGAAGDYLEVSAVALLATAALRFAVAYGRYLDAVDAEVAGVPATTGVLAGPVDRRQFDLPWGRPSLAADPRRGFSVGAIDALTDPAESPTAG